MNTVQEVFIRINQKRQEQKTIKAAYRDALKNSALYQQVTEELNVLKAKKKEIENDVKATFGNDFSQLDHLKLDIETDLELLTDLAINQLMSGETIQVVDEHQQAYTPVFAVKFKKVETGIA